MNENVKQEELNEVETLEIQPLADEDLDAVVGGLCSIWCCSKAQQQAIGEE